MKPYAKRHFGHSSCEISEIFAQEEDKSRVPEDFDPFYHHLRHVRLETVALTKETLFIWRGQIMGSTKFI